MRYAIPGSIIVHVAVIGVGFAFLSWPESSEPTIVESVSVDIVSISSFSSNQTPTIESQASVNRVSSGARIQETVETEILEPIEPAEAQDLPETMVEAKEPIEVVKPIEMIEPETTVAKAVVPVTQPVVQETIKVAAVSQVVTDSEPLAALSGAVQLSVIKPNEPVEAQDIAPPQITNREVVEPLIMARVQQVIEAATVSETEPDQMVPPRESRPVETVSALALQVNAEQLLVEKPAAVTPLTSLVLQPRSETVVDAAPVPMTRTAAQITTPTYPSESPREKTKKPRKVAQPPQNTQAGNSGRNNTDSNASAAASRAAVSNYPGKVQSKLRRALRYPAAARGVSGEVRVQFSIAANGRASGIRVVKSSGNAALDKAAIATVKRAAPFPAIPPGSGRSSWKFTVPLLFTR